MMYRLVFLVFGAVLLQGAALGKMGGCGDGECASPADSKEGCYTVLSPVGRCHTRMIQQGARLDSLEGKTLALVGGSFMAYVTHPELKHLIQEKYPSTRVLLLNEIGSAGPWPGPGVVRERKDAFVARLREMKVDAVVAGNGGCGLCTPREMGSCIAAEYEGIPSVMIAAPGFVDQARSTARAAGVPVARVAQYPGAFSAHSHQVLRENTRRVLWPQIERALMEPLSDGERVPEVASSQENGVVMSGSMSQVNAFFAERGWTDGLPIFPPTREAVAEFLSFCDLPAQEVVAVVLPSRREVTVELVAVNGVMAGCPPEFMPLLVAMTRAMAQGDFRRTLSSTHAWTPFCWINGPVARQLGIDCGQGEISHQRNAVMGRFINLAMLNFGGYHIKENRMGSFGYLMPWCLAEDEGAAVRFGWRPYHMQQGFQLNDNALTAASALCWGNNLAPATSDAKTMMELMAWDATEKQQFAVGSGTPFVYRTMLITGQVAQKLAELYESKEELEAALVETARVPLGQRCAANYWAHPGSAFNPATYSFRRHEARIAREEGAAETSLPPWLFWCGRKTIQTVPVMREGKTAFLVTGDTDRNKTMCVPGGGFVTVRIELPRDWNRLMERKGYAPLSSFYLSSRLQPARCRRPFGRFRRR